MKMGVGDPMEALISSPIALSPGHEFFSSPGWGGPPISRGEIAVASVTTHPATEPLLLSMHFHDSDHGSVKRGEYGCGEHGFKHRTQ